MHESAINEWYRYPQGKPWTQEASPPLPPQGAGYLSLRFLHSLGNGPIGIVPLPSLRWEIKKVLFLGIVAVLLVTFSACDLALGGIPTEDIATRGTVGVVEKGKTPQAFTATVNLYQDLTSVVTRSMGNSDHYKTVEETLYSQQYGPFGGAIVSDWDLLDGKNVVMTNVTNYNLDPLSLEIAGSNHSLIHVVDEQGAVVLTLQANGVLDGSLFGATIDMNWVVKDSYGADVKARGKIDGTFTWAIFDPTSMSVEFVLPHGTFNLTGTYH